MKLLVLDSSSISLWLKNELKISHLRKYMKEVDQPIDEPFLSLLPYMGENLSKSSYQKGWMKYQIYLQVIHDALSKATTPKVLHK